MTTKTHLPLLHGRVQSRGGAGYAHRTPAAGRVGHLLPIGRGPNLAPEAASARESSLGLCRSAVPRRGGAQRGGPRRH